MVPSGFNKSAIMTAFRKELPSLRKLINSTIVDCPAAMAPRRMEAGSSWVSPQRRKRQLRPIISSHEQPVRRRNGSSRASSGLSACRGSLSTAATLLFAIKVSETSSVDGISLN